MVLGPSSFAIDVLDHLLSRDSGVPTATMGVWPLEELDIGIGAGGAAALTHRIPSSGFVSDRHEWNTADQGREQSFFSISRLSQLCS